MTPRTIPLSGGCAGAVNAATFGPDGQTLETAGDKGLMLWDLAAANRSHCVVQYPAANGPQGTAHFSPDGRLLATADYRGHIFLRDLTHPTQLQNIDATDPGPGATTTAEVFSGDAHLLATGDERGTTRLWDVSDPARAQPISGPLTTDKPVTALAFSPDRHTIAIAAENGAIALWDITDVAHPKRRETPLQGQYASYSMMFSPDGQMLAVGSQTDSATTLWDLTDAARPQLIGESFPAFAGPAGSFVRLVAFSADGQILITAGDAGVAWDLHAIRALRANPIGAACAITGAGLDPDSWSRLVPQISYVDTCAAR